MLPQRKHFSTEYLTKSVFFRKKEFLTLYTQAIPKPVLFQTFVDIHEMLQYNKVLKVL